ncbi:acyl-CoA thioesterase/BAAT N-terminal domain-containing protein [Erythrobacter sp. W302b]|uniref:acyl-CoA thioesterase/BAAT N-terminal domain-containing protein n=1 Tax=Erythrobacter sp. W302b TaxID=3389874 RepID=UPI00396B44DC
MPAYAQQVDLPQTLTDAEPVTVGMLGFTPGERVEIEAVRRDADGTYRSAATFVVGPDGAIDLARDPAIAGSYQGVDPAGLFWSMRPIRPGTAEPAGIAVRALFKGKKVAGDEAALAELPNGVVMRPVAEFVGARLYRPAGTDRLGVIIVLGGSEGGAGFGRRMGPVFAARGFAVLALPYYAPSWGSQDLPGLPGAFTDIPVDRLEDVRRWIADQPDLDPARIGLHGISKGGEFALIAAARMPWLRAVSGIVPSDVVWEGWGSEAPSGTASSFSWDGQPLPFVPYRGMEEAIAALARGERRALTVPHLEGRRAHPDRAAAARIPVEQFKGSLLIAGGDRDATWPSGEMVRALAERRAEAGLPTVALSFAEAGHSLGGTGWTPMDYEGRPVPARIDAAAQRIVHAAVIDFFRRTLAEGDQSGIAVSNFTRR